MNTSLTTLAKWKKILGLSFILAKANFKLRNEGSYLGLLWYLLNPLSLFIIILFIRGEAFRASDLANYPVYLLVGLLMFHYMSQIIGSSMNLIQSNGNFIKSIHIYPETIVISRVLQSCFSHIFEICLLTLASVYFGSTLLGLIPYILVFIIFSFFVLGLSFLFSAIGVHFNDLGNIWAVASTLLFFVTPVFHAPQAGSTLASINHYNPIAIFLDAGREMFVSGSFPQLSTWFLLFIISSFTLAVGLMVFEREKDYFAELV